MYEFAILTVFPFAVAFAGAMDLFTMTIPNRISLAMIAAFAVLAPLAGLGLGNMAYHAAPDCSCWRSGCYCSSPVGLVAATPSWPPQWPCGWGLRTSSATCSVWRLPGVASALLFMRGEPIPLLRTCLRPAVGGASARSLKRRPVRIALAAGALSSIQRHPGSRA